MLICKKFHKEDRWCLSYKAALHGIYGCMRRVKGKQVQILYELVTVIRE